MRVHAHLLAQVLEVFKGIVGLAFQTHPSDQTALGLKWKEAGSEKPSTGTEIKNELLAAALQKKVEFKKEEWEDFKVTDLSIDSYIKAVNRYFKPSDQYKHSYQYDFMSEAKIPETLQKIRMSSVTASDGGESLDWYLQYLKRESTICVHMLHVLDKICDTTGKNGDTVLTTFSVGELENKMMDLGSSVRKKTLQPWAKHMCNLLESVVLILDCVLRSQLIFTLQLVDRNSKSIIQKLEKRIGSDQQGRPENDNENCDLEDHSQKSYDPETHDLLSDNDESQGSEGDSRSAVEQAGASSNTNVPVHTGEREIADRLIAPHEHITQRKFNQASVKILEEMVKRSRFKNKFQWIKLFEDSDSEDEGKHAGNARQRNEAGNESDDDDQVVKNSRKNRSCGSDTPKKVEFVDDELDVPLKSKCGMEHEALFSSKDTWGYGPPVLSPFCATSIMSEHVPVYHFPV
jgi:hypothetical protein